MANNKNVVQGAYVTVIAAKEQEAVKLRVAAYARVSSDSEDQINSYLAQVDYYTKYIRSQENWELADIYADEGLSGMESKHRSEFHRLISDCKAGKIDRILVKSVSRFARNQEDYLYYLRELMRIGVSVCFEKENIDTSKMTSEQVADIYGAFAQMETTGHAQNMRLSNRIRMEKGIFVPAKAPYSYRLIRNELVIVPEEAIVVQRIYQMFLGGQGIFQIMNTLNQEGVKHTNGTGSTGKWNRYSIHYILTNVTYTGDQIWQKTFVTEVLPYRKRRNRGEKPQYFAEDCCPPIIDKATYERVQALMAEKKEQYPLRPEVTSLLRKRVYCAVCGSLCKRKTIRENVYWVCRKHDEGKENCPVRQVPETLLTNLIRKCHGKLYLGQETMLKPMLRQLEELRERELKGNKRITDIDREMAQLAEQNLVLNRLKDKGFVDPALYIFRRDEIKKL